MFRYKNGQVGLCKTCDPKIIVYSEDKRAVYMRRYMTEADRKAKRNNQSNFRRNKLKSLVFAHYGGKCSCLGCEEKELTFLVLDHIDGGGNEERKLGLYSDTLYRHIIINNYPDCYQILCANCNMSKHIIGTCAHRSIK